MQRIIALLVIGLLTIGVSQANGQSLKDLMKKKKDKTEETTEEKKENKTGAAVRQGVNKRLDRLFGTSSEEETKTVEETEKEEVRESSSSKSNNNDFSSKTSATGIGMNAIMSGLGITGSTDIKEVYKFDALI